MHDHNDCKHELKVCDHCDVAYCAKCKKEWGDHEHVNFVPYPVYSRPFIPTWTQPYWYGGAWGSNSTIKIVGGVNNGTNLALMQGAQ